MKTTTSNPHDIVEKLLILILILIAIVLSYFGGEVFHHLANSTRGGRIVAMPGIDGSLILGPGYTPAETMAAVYASGFLFYFWLGLLLLSLIRDAIKKYRAKKSSSTRV